MLGTPDKQVWPDGYKLAQVRRVKFPEYPRTALDKLMPHASSEAIEVMDGLMMWNPDQRLTAAQCLAHKYFVNERERHEAKERERAREKERERRERRERERAEGDAREEARDKERRPRERSDRGHKAHDTERSLKAQASSNNDDALSTAAPSLLPSVRPTARDRFPEGHVASRQPGPSSLVDAPPRHAGGGATERWRSDATNTEMSRSVTKNQQETAQDLRSDLPAPSVAGGGTLTELFTVSASAAIRRTDMASGGAMGTLLAAVCTAALWRRSSKEHSSCWVGSGATVCASTTSSRWTRRAMPTATVRARLTEIIRAWRVGCTRPGMDATVCASLGSPARISVGGSAAEEMLAILARRRMRWRQDRGSSLRQLRVRLASIRLSTKARSRSVSVPVCRVARVLVPVRVVCTVTVHRARDLILMVDLIASSMRCVPGLGARAWV